MNKIYFLLFFIILVLIGCTIKQFQEKLEEKIDISGTAEISDIGVMDEELDVRSLETLEEDLNYIENI